MFISDALPSWQQPTVIYIHTWRGWHSWRRFILDTCHGSRAHVLCSQKTLRNWHSMSVWHIWRWRHARWTLVFCGPRHAKSIWWVRQSCPTRYTWIFHWCQLETNGLRSRFYNLIRILELWRAFGATELTIIEVRPTIHQFFISVNVAIAWETFFKAFLLLERTWWFCHEDNALDVKSTLASSGDELSSRWKKGSFIHYLEYHHYVPYLPIPYPPPIPFTGFAAPWALYPPIAMTFISRSGTNSWK